MRDTLEKENAAPRSYGHDLVLGISGDSTLQAADLGELLTALSADYRRMYRGRNLAVIRIEDGSLYVFLQDLALAASLYMGSTVEIAKGANTLLEFAKSIKDLLSKEELEAPQAQRRRQRDPYRTVHSMVKVAAQSGSEISVRHTTADGETLDVRVTPADAIEIRARTMQTDQKLATIKQRLPTPDDATEMDGMARAVSFADRIEHLALGDSGQLKLLIIMTVHLLRDSGNFYLVEALAQELNSRGYASLAAAVRAEVGDD